MVHFSVLKLRNSKVYSMTSSKKIVVRILSKEDEVINVWSENNQVSIAVKHKNGEVEIFRLEPDENGLPRVNMQNSWSISFGKGEVDISETGKDVNVKTF